MPGALDWLMQRLGGNEQSSATVTRQTDPRDLAAAFDKMTGPAGDQAFQSSSGQEEYGPRGIARRREPEVLHHRLDLQVR